MQLELLARLRILLFGLFACVFAGANVFAAQPATLINQNAVVLRNPADTLLISIARAGNRLVAVGGHGAIVYSDDNGLSWHQSSVPTSVTITAVAFADLKSGWAAGGQGIILGSVDGGLTWKRLMTGDQVIPLMTAAATAFASGNPTAEVAQRALRRVGIFAADGPNKPFLAVLPLSEKSAIVFGAYRMTVITNDGGESWSDWSLHIGDPISHNIYDVTRAGASIYAVGEDGTALRSADQGNSFEIIPPPSPDTLIGVLGTKKNSVVTFGVDGNVFRSTDQGQSWSPSNITSGSDLTAGTVLASGEIVVVSEDGHVYYSLDDGVMFRDSNLNLGMALFGVVEAANHNIVIVGSGGTRTVPATALQ